jgi:hypothetical protein
MTYSDSVVLEKIFKRPTQFLGFCDYLSFKEDLALYSNKRPMGHIAHQKNLDPYRNIFPISNMHFISPIQPLGAMILTNLLSF